MAEFGEQLRKAREAKGYTQQSFAERLYVTRQTVSRWESGARYPDLHTAKKISETLGLSLDALLAGEEMYANIDKIPLLVKNSEVLIQTVVYSTAFLSYLLMSYFSWKAILFPNTSEKYSPAGQISILTIYTFATYVVLAVLLFYGIVLSIKCELTSKKIAIIVTFPYFLYSLNALISHVEMFVQNNGQVQILSFLVELILPVFFGNVIILFFEKKDTMVPCFMVETMCGISLIYTLYAYGIKISHSTDLGFVVSTIHVAGRISVLLLTGYQTHVYDQKKQKAISI